MDNTWNDFKNKCTQDSPGTELLSIRVGSWLDVQAVREAVQGNSTAKAMLQFFADLDEADVDAMSAGSMYLSFAERAATTTDKAPVYLSPPAVTGFYDRKSGAPLPDVPTDYWSALPARHRDILTRLRTASFTNYLNDAAYATGNQAGTASKLVSEFYNNAKQLYADAAQVYQYTYSGLVVTADNGNVSPKIITFDIATTGASCASTPLDWESGLKTCVGPVNWINTSAFASDMSIVTVPSKSSGAPEFGVRFTFTDPMILISPFEDSAVCADNKYSPDRTYASWFSISMAYTMPDTSHSPCDPYGAAC